MAREVWRSEVTHLMVAMKKRKRGRERKIRERGTGDKTHISKALSQ
jgi:hypothetical protein